MVADNPNCPPPRMPVKGLRSRNVVNAERGVEIIEAFARYVSVDKEIPASWFTELREITDRLMECEHD